MSKLIICFVCAFVLSTILTIPFLKFLKKRKYGQTILEYVSMHEEKQNTPTMGGIVFLLSTIVVSLLFCDKNNFLLPFTLICTFGFAVIGFLDDYIKVHFKRNLGLTPWQKIIGQGGICLIISLYVYFSNNFEIVLPFSFSGISLGFFVIPIIFFTCVATVNSVNLIDGLDGLNAKVSIVYLLCFSVILLLFASFNKNFAELQNLALGNFALSGALLGFLIFNSHKAKVFMGDVGSLGIGGFIACEACCTGLILYIPLIGIMYVITALSVILQVLYYKKAKKRIFLMAPLHHHFEKKGWNEEKIVTLYTICGIIVGLICIYFTMI